MPVQTSLYGASKLACESYAQAFQQFAPIKFWAFRFANVVGERCRRGVIWDFVHKLQKSPKELEILGNGKQSKEYLYVKDCVEGMMTGWRKSPGPLEAFNLGQPKQTLVDEVADIVTAEMKLDGVRRKYTGGERGWIGDNKLVELSLGKIMKLGWRPATSPKEAISVTTQWTLANG
jgi:UDP-glucose 4-epimerase